jgi:hypothetical protein
MCRWIHNLKTAEGLSSIAKTDQDKLMNPVNHGPDEAAAIKFASQTSKSHTSH